jgi:5-methyltetrahydropteroyltriglutamate--homocysteine methyltransferase
MRHSTDRILVSHAGNLPRPDDLNKMIAERDSEAFKKRSPSAVREIVQRQVDLGVDIVNDGEYVKAGSYTGYIQDSITGFEIRPDYPNVRPKREGVGARDQQDFRGFYESGLWLSGSGGPVRAGFATPGRPPALAQVRVCTGPVKYIGHAAIQSDVANFNAAIAEKNVEGFIAALGPLSVGGGPRNEY